MRGLAALALGGAMLLAMAPAWAQDGAAPFHGKVQTPPVAPTPFTPAPSPPPPSIGTIFGVPVRVWAPVAPSYNQMADRNGAASPLLPTQPYWWVTPERPHG